MNRTLLARAGERLREFFFLEEAERQSSRFTLAQRQSVLAYYDAGKRRLVAAKTLREPREAPSGLILYREALLCMARAILLSKDEHIDVEPLAPGAAWNNLDQAIADWKDKAPADVLDAEPLVVVSDSLAFDRLSPDEAARKIRVLDSATQWLSKLIEPRSPRELKLTRILRQAAAGIIICGLLAAFVVWCLMPKDLALHMPVSSTPPSYQTTAAAAVDGQKNGRFGYHSADADSPWLTIDLQREKRISKIEVYGRGDCCFDQSLPLSLAFSDDGATFHDIAQRTSAFSESDPWIVDTGLAAGRFVRLQREQHGALVLGEVVVYGRDK